MATTIETTASTAEIIATDIQEAIRAIYAVEPISGEQQLTNELAAAAMRYANSLLDLDAKGAETSAQVKAVVAAKALVWARFEELTTAGA